MKQKDAKLRVCASCEWIFRANGEGCPKCGFAHYGARFVYGDKAYRFEMTQEPWMNKKMADYQVKLLDEIKSSAPPKKSKIFLAHLFASE